MPSKAPVKSTSPARSPKPAKPEIGRVLLSRVRHGKKALGKDCTFYGSLALTDDGYAVHRASGRIITTLVEPKGSMPLATPAFVEHINLKLTKHWPELDRLKIGAYWPEGSCDALRKAISAFKG